MGSPIREESPIPNKPNEPMSRSEYIRRQNEIFKELSAYDDPASFTESMLAPSRDEQMKMREILRLFAAHVDSEMVDQVHQQRRINEFVEDHKLNITGKSFLPEAILAEDAYTQLVDMRRTVAQMLVRYSQLEHSHKQIGSEHAELKMKYAKELSLRVRLSHSVRVLSEKLTSLDEEHRSLIKSGRKTEKALQDRIFELRAELEKRQLSTGPTVRTEKLPNDLDGLGTRLQELHAEVSRLNNLPVDDGKVPDQPAQLMGRVLALVESAQSQRNQQAQKLLKAYVDQVNAREAQLIATLEATRAEKDAYHSWCQHLNKELFSQKEDNMELHDRMATLVQAVKHLRSTASTAPPPPPTEDTSQLDYDQLIKALRSVLTDGIKDTEPTEPTDK